MLDAPSDEFEVGSLGGHLKLSMRDGEQKLIAWAQETRAVLAKCGAEETAALQGKD
jgi:hypothetical protein